MKMKNNIARLSIIISVLCSTLILCGCSIDANKGAIEEPEPTLLMEVESNNIITEEEKLLAKPANRVLEVVEHKSVTTKLNIKMVGDSLIHSPVYKAARGDDGVYNFDFMFEHVKPDIESADLAIINQETIMIADRNNYSSYPRFGSPLEVGDAIVNAGFNVVCHATNHTVDKGIQGVTDTLAFWNDKYPDITVLGIHGNADESDIKYINENDITVGLLNYTYGLNGLESLIVGNEYIVDLLSETQIEEYVAEAKSNADFVIAILHVGTEYVYEPTEYQVNQVDRFIDSGADIVICAHPHVVEPYEMRTTDAGNTALVFYSLGNFVSSQDEVPRVLGGMADITISKTVDTNGVTLNIDEYDMIPLVTHQEKGVYTAYRLDEYTDELCARHKLQSKQSFNVEYLWSLYNSIVK